ncbi:hypothetical protein H6F86_16380 [Phormidium sp. FACHB-592]|uniref:Uncharacterized protein n=1 Tax=Stenomitos frigidus AS-A4 TaxID=2933935 RepID=A0ABV0KQR4_9CYAN|nr:hypothetical protein [Phormidium sp. FACHB-592]MBD2075442.1 hypothetical protein [Phormidium sp. FACHB-592]
MTHLSESLRVVLSIAAILLSSRVAEAYRPHLHKHSTMMPSGAIALFSRWLSSGTRAEPGSYP